MRWGEGALESDVSWFVEVVRFGETWVFSSVLFISGGFRDRFSVKTQLNGLPLESA